MSISVLIAVVHWLGIGLTAVATGYACAALYAVVRASSPPSLIDDVCHNEPCPIESVSVLKPLDGAEPGLHENLRSFCLQAHPDYQLIFGVRAVDDPAIDIVNKLRAEFPRLAITLVVDPRTHGTNPKVSNLINMLPHAMHSWLVLADSDIRVPANYLVRVTAPLANPAVGIVTCLYRGIARRGFWSRLGRLFIDDWFAPSVWLSHAFGSTRFAFGSTIALRRDTLASIGGFEVLRDTLADDFWLGELTRRRGLRTLLSDLVIGTEVVEDRLNTLWAHELRWLRTIRAIAPLGFAMTWICFTSPVLLLGLALEPSTWNEVITLTGGIARVLLYFFQRRFAHEASPWYEVLLVPLRDGLLLLEWATALTSWRVTWRGEILHARGDGHAPHY